MEDSKYRSGFIAIIGETNAGKSSLLNHILQMNLSIVTEKKQTTLHNITGILTTSTAQLIFIDTPGVHKLNSKFNNLLKRTYLEALDGVDIIILLIDVMKFLKIGFSYYIQNFEILKNQKQKIIVVFSKSDLMNQDDIMKFKKITSNILNPELISINNENSIARLVNKLEKKLPISNKYYDNDELTVRSEKFFASEIIRKQLYLKLDNELPYRCAVVITMFKRMTNNFKSSSDIIKIYAEIVVAKDSNKGILIGHKGEMIRNIRKSSEYFLKKFFRCKVNVTLFVKIRKNWFKNEMWLKKLIEDNR